MKVASHRCNKPLRLSMWRATTSAATFVACLAPCAFARSAARSRSRRAASRRKGLCVLAAGTTASLGPEGLQWWVWVRLQLTLAMSHHGGLHHCIIRSSIGCKCCCHICPQLIMHSTTSCPYSAFALGCKFRFRIWFWFRFLNLV